MDKKTEQKTQKANAPGEQKEEVRAMRIRLKTGVKGGGDVLAPVHL